MIVVESVMRGVAVLAPLGARLDAASRGEFQDRLEAVLARGQRLVVCDLSQVRFMDSTGLAVILKALRMLSGQGSLACAGLTPQVAQLFRVTRLDRGLIPLFADVEEAVEALADSGGGGS